MKYARIEASRVVELVDVDGDITERYHPSLQFIPTDKNTAVGDVLTDDGFKAYTPPAVDLKRAAQAQIDALERESMTNRGARELQLALMRERGAADGLQTDAAIAAKVPYFAKLLALDTQIRALRAQL